MRILVLVHEYPPVGGGGGRAAQDICAGLSRLGHQVRVLTARCGNLPPSLTVGSLTVIRLPSGRREPFRAGLKAMAGYVWAAFWHGLREIRRFKPHVIHVHFAVPAGAAAWALSLLTGVPYVLTAHLGDVPGGVPEKTGRWFRFLYPFTPPIWKRAARVAAVSQFTRTLALQRYPVPIQVIPNGVDLHALDPGTIQVNTPPRIIFAGRFMPQKNPLQIVRTLDALRRLPWTCTLAGDGPLRPQVEAEIAARGLQARFSLPGWLTPEQVLEEYRRSDILFLPSLSEGLPVVGVQGMALGLALVLSAVGGSPELVHEGVNGHLVAPHDPAGYKKALRHLLSHPSCLLHARQASRRLAAQFDLNAVVKSYERIFEEVGRKIA